jgi:hypothetical protein
MLDDASRTKLDGIVQQMTQNNEPDTNIQTVVNDFKTKYDKPAAKSAAPSVVPLTDAQTFMGKDIVGANNPNDSQGFLPSLFQSTIGSKGLAGAFQGIGRAVASGQNAAAAAEGTSNIQQSNGILSHITDQLLQKAQSLPADDPARQSLLNQARENIVSMGHSEETAHGILTTASNNQYTPGQIIGTGLNAGLTTATFGSAGLGGGLLSRTAQSALLGTGYQFAGDLQGKKTPGIDLLGGAAIGAAIPLAGSGLSFLKNNVVGGGLETLGTKIQTSVIRPSMNDLEKGFKIENVNKYDLGGSLNQTLVKVNAKMNTLGQQLKQLVSNSGDTLDLAHTYAETEKALTSGKAQNFGENKAILRVLEDVKAEIEHLTGSGDNATVDLATAQEVKRAAGTLGSWVNGFADKDANARQQVYTKFYQVLRQQIEGADVGPEIKAINKQLSDLIPINNAVVRRIPVADRNNAISLSDAMGLIGTVFDPRTAVVAGINKASKSGIAGNALVKAGQAIQKKAVNLGPVGQRIFGQ